MKQSRTPSELVVSAATAAFEASSFGPLIVGLADALCAAGAQVDRIHVPMSSLNGFQHPLHATVLVLWERGREVQIDHVGHEDVTTDSGEIDLRMLLRDSPFRPLFFDGRKANGFRLDGGELPFPVLRELAAAGYTDYLAFGLSLPNGSRQVLGMASRAPAGFGQPLEELLLEMEPVISLAFFAVYQAAISVSVSQAYIGPRTAIRVLGGAITRGRYETLDAGILFCDVRGFTRMSTEMGPERIVPVMNQIFDCVGQAVADSSGEILKFMGDAVLVVFPRDQFGEDGALARQMVEVVSRASAGVEELGKRLLLDLRMGFGLHIGVVTYGNVGTRERLDFTVLGPAVNLAARLESLTKSLGVTLAASASVAEHVPELQFSGRHRLAGIAEEIPVWCERGETSESPQYLGQLGSRQVEPSPGGRHGGVVSEPGSTSKGPVQWEQRYIDDDLPWDSGKPDVHLGQFIDASSMSPCRALEVGCGTGTNAVWLTGRGFDVVGLDLSPTAIERATAKANAAGADCQLLVADFLIDPVPGGPFGLVYDRGCFHSLSEASDRACFAGRVAEVLDSGGTWHSLIGSTDGPPRNDGPPRRSAADIVAAVEPHFEVLELKSTTFDEEGHQAKRAWVLVARKRAQVN